MKKLSKTNPSKKLSMRRRVLNLRRKAKKLADNRREYNYMRALSKLNRKHSH